MRDERKSKKVLIEELVQTRCRLAELEGRLSDPGSAGRALRGETSFLRQLLDSSPAFFVALDRSGRTILMNETLMEALGLNRENVAGVDYLDTFVPPEDRERLSGIFKTILVHGSSEAIQSRIEGKPGERLTVEWYGTPVLQSGGEVDFIFLVGIDVTERKLAEKALHEEKERFKLLTDTAPIGIVKIKDDGVWDYVNPKFTELFGYQASDVPDGKSWFGLAYPNPDYRKKVVSSWSGASVMKERGSQETGIFSVTCKDGSSKVVRFISVLLDNGEIVMTCEDVTEQLRSEETRQESERRYRKLVENANDIIFITNVRGLFTMMNPIGSHISGYSEEELIGKHYLDLVAPEYRDMAGKHYSIQLRRRVLDSYLELPIVTKDGQRLWLGQNVQLILKNNKVEGFQSICRNITERKNALEKLEKSEERYKKLYETSKKREELYQSLLNSSADAVVIYDMDGKVRYVSPSFTRIFGWTIDEVGGKRIPFVPESEWEATMEMIDCLIEDGTPCTSFETKRCTKDGRLLDISISASRYHDHEGRPEGMLVHLRDITARKEAEVRLRESEARYRALLGAMPDPVVVYDPEGRATFINDGFKQTYGWSPEEISGDSNGFVPDEEAERTRKAWQSTLSGEKVILETKRHTRGGALVDVQLRGAILLDRDGNPSESIILHRDITQRKRSELEKENLITDLIAAREALHYEATHDGLSGIWNRSAILDILHRELCRAQRETIPLGVVIGDVDYFKEINDRHGHLAGDAVLRELARRIASNIRPYDSVGRYGGEEFILVLPNCDKNNARKMADRLRRSFPSRPMETAEGNFYVTMSFGISAYDGKGACDVDTMIREADEALYRAKNLGRNRVEI